MLCCMRWQGSLTPGGQIGADLSFALTYGYSSDGRLLLTNPNPTHYVTT